MSTNHQGSVGERADASSGSYGRVIATFAWQHLRAAAIFRDHLIRIESENAGAGFGSFFEDVRSYASACIVSGASSLEALINECFIAHDGTLRRSIGDFESEFWGRGGIDWKPILDKYQHALRMLGKREFDELSAPYRDAWALIEFRNAIVHYKPTWDPDRKRKVELIEVLGGKYELSPFPDEGADFVSMKSMSAGCGRWVVSTVVAFVKEFHERTGLVEGNKLAALSKLA